MFGRKNGKKPDFITSALAETTVLPISDNRQGLDFLVGFFSAIRPARGKPDPGKNLEALTAVLHQNPVFLNNLRHAILSQLIRTDLSSALTESGIPLARGFWQEFFGRLRHKLLPPLQNENDFLYVLDRVFFRNEDFQWVEKIPRKSWIQFFESVGITLRVHDKRIVRQLLQSMKTLTFQVAQLGLEKEVLNYITQDEQDKNPFVEQNYLIHDLEEWMLKEEPANPPYELLERIGLVFAKCYESLERIRENQSQKGASLHQTYILILLANRLDRMSILIDLLDNNIRDKNSKAPVEQDTGKFVDFFRMLVRYENRKNSILEFMSRTMGYLAYQIAEHKGVKGNKYITSSPAEYRAMLLSAMGGGAWVCMVVLIKNLLIKMPMAIFWHGFAYSVNYSIGFILIEETHTTLATKQPAFTASAVAVSLDTRKNSQPNLYNLALTVAKVSRSQIASFAGNLMVMFPGMWLIAWGYEKIVGSKLVAGEAAAAILKDQHPWQSLSLLYAANTGFFLFLSGIIAGYVQNKIQYSHVAERLQTHPLLRLSFSTDRLRRLGDYVEKHAGSIVGSIALGFFLGMASIIVKIFGIPFDIRHITISAGNTSLAVYGLGFDHVRPWYLVTVVMGVLGIGLVNFLVSFSLAFFVAVKSRGVRLKDYPEFLGILFRYFRNNPLDFIRPRSRKEQNSQVSTE
ncbi:site-specific recombinase [Flavitalea flava]